MARVSIGTCANLAEAALVRSAFKAHDIHVLINAEQHASMLGGLGGAFVPLHIFVDSSDAEQAAELLADLRAKGRADDAIAEAEGSNSHDDLDAEALGAGPAPSDYDEVPEEEAAAVIRARTEGRRRIGILMLISLAMAFSAPYVMYRPALGILVIVGGLGLMAYTMWGSRKKKLPDIPRARIKR